jgi:N-methylhydantoinase B
MDRVKCKPWGLQGGLSGFGNSVAVHRFNETDEQHFPNGKAFNQVIKPGDAYILRSGGGGGFGSPLERDIDALQRDVTGGYVSREAAEKYYGAVFKADSELIDRAATTTRRAEMAALGLPEDEPIAETVAPSHDHAHPHDHRHEHEHLTPEERAVLAMAHRCCS